MLLFESPAEEKPEAKPELITVAAYLDREHERMLAFMQAKGALNKSEVVRQCIRLGYRTLLESERAGKGGAA